MSKAIRLRIPISDKDHAQGAQNAKLELIKYGDYECPHCYNAYGVVKQLQASFGDDLRFVFRNFPLTELRPHSMTAASAAEAAGLQKRFWLMHDMLYENQDSLDDRSLLAYADALDLDLARFAEDLTSSEVQERILADQYGGARSGVNGTPTFYVNGYRYDGDWSYLPFLGFLQSVLRKVSEGELDQAG